MYAGLFDGNEAVEMVLDSERLAYVQLVRGALSVNGEALHAGDAMALAGESRLQLSAGEQAEVLFFDLAA